MSAKRLTHEGRAFDGHVIKPSHHVGHEGGARHVSRPPLAAPVAALVQCENAVACRQPRGGFVPLSPVPGETVEKDDEGASAPIVERGQTISPALQAEPPHRTKANLANRSRRDERFGCSP